MQRSSLVLSMCFTFSLAACTHADDIGTPKGEYRSALPDSELQASCVGHCGEQSDGACWCDDLCHDYGDCCEDKVSVCDEPESTDGEPSFCGGIGGFPCPPGEMCVDDPDDDCDPAQGGADCGGICVPDPGQIVCNNDADCPYEFMCGLGECVPCPLMLCAEPCPNGFVTTPNGCMTCECIDDDTPPPSSCEGQCGGASQDESCWCDGWCTFFGDCCTDYDSNC